MQGLERVSRRERVDFLAVAMTADLHNPGMTKRSVFASSRLRTVGSLATGSMASG